jgi:hypothetical protein
MDRAWFLLKDPHWTLLWWNISEQTRARLFGSFAISNRAYLLRVHDVTDILFDGNNSHFFLEIEAAETSDHWYIRLPEAGRVYCAETGFRDDQGRFVSAARSNALWMPPDAPDMSHREPNWSCIDLG